MNAPTVSAPSRRIRRSRFSARRDGELLLALPGQAVAVVVRAVGVQEALQRQAEILMGVGYAGGARGGQRHPVVAAHARDDLALLGLADRVVIVAHELERAVVGLGAGIDEQRPRHRHRREREQALGELDRRSIGLAAEQVIGRQARHLLLRGLHEARLAEAECCAPEARHALEIAMAGLVEHVDALAALDHERPLLGMLGEVGERVDQRLTVANGERVGALHDSAAPGRCSSWDDAAPGAGSGSAAFRATRRPAHRRPSQPEIAEKG